MIQTAGKLLRKARRQLSRVPYAAESGWSVLQSGRFCRWQTSSLFLLSHTGFHRGTSWGAYFSPISSRTFATTNWNKRKKKKYHQKKNTIPQGKPKNKKYTRKYPKPEKQKHIKKRLHPSVLNLPIELQEPEPAENIANVMPYLYATGSNHVYVAACAIDDDEVEEGDVDDDNDRIDPKTLFAKDKVPKLFRSGATSFYHKKQSGFKNWPHHDYNIPEIAVIGKSNVGKSSLINAMMGKQLAICSKTPGRTQQVFYFGVFRKPDEKIHNLESYLHPSQALGYLVDLPGYGYAAAPDASVEAWQQMTQDFLLARRDRGTLQRTFLLVDARRGLEEFDRMIMRWFDEGEIPYTMVLTKCDSVSKAMVVKQVNEACMRYHAQQFSDEEDGTMSPFIHATSAAKKNGIRELLGSIETEFGQYYMQHRGGVDAEEDSEIEDEEYEEGADLDEFDEEDEDEDEGSDLDDEVGDHPFGAFERETDGIPEDFFLNSEDIEADIAYREEDEDDRVGDLTTPKSSRLKQWR